METMCTSVKTPWLLSNVIDADICLQTKAKFHHAKYGRVMLLWSIAMVITLPKVQARPLGQMQVKVILWALGIRSLYHMYIV